ncbi:hypothetical protein BXZ70DRAFT_556454 [Cristinia sonorae]|uniref:DUF6534 domain-containing protein n=1 Tax=Cristinia sonorae TaxID=1940300 RepID=A0A8K0UI04_9AGAR|nr:hypothetical protein BXZ70DRAFT_556454 [Cristinia sonorae]
MGDMSGLRTMSTPISSPSTLITGPLLLGHIVTCLLMGVLTVQTFTYYLAFPNDNWQTKSVVVFTFVLEVATTVIFTYDIFRIFCVGWGSLEELDNLFYGWRIYTLSKSYALPVIIALLSVTQLVFNVYGGIAGHFIRHISRFPDTILFTTVLVCFTSATLCDLLIAGSMSYLFWKARKSTITRQTSTKLARLITLTVETGLITAISTAMMFVLFVARKNTLLYAGFLTPASKLYSNSLMVLLNSRVRIVGGRVQDENPSGQLSIRTSFWKTATFRRGNARVPDIESNFAIELPKGSDEVVQRIHHEPL